MPRVFLENKKYCNIVKKQKIVGVFMFLIKIFLYVHMIISLLLFMGFAFIIYTLPRDLINTFPRYVVKTNSIQEIIKVFVLVIEILL